MKTLVLAVAFTLTLSASATNAAEIRVVSSVGVKTALDDLKPVFEKASGHTLAITYGTAVPLHRQLAAGTGFDVAVLTPALIADLVKLGKVKGDSQAIVAKAGVGVAIRAGAAKPDISNADTFKRAMLGAKSVTFTKEGQSGIAVARVFEKLGITKEMAPKIVYNTRSGMAAAGVVEGKAELALTLISEILPIAGAELAGPFPAEIQDYVVFTAGISSDAGNAAAAKALVDFLRTPATAPVLRKRGLEPG